MEYQVTLKDGSVRKISQGTTGYDFAGDLSRTVQKNATVAKWNGQFLDLAFFSMSLYIRFSLILLI